MSATSARSGEALALATLLALLACSSGGGGAGGVSGTAGGGDGGTGGTVPDGGTDGGTGGTPPTPTTLHSIAGTVSGASSEVQLWLGGSNVRLLGLSAVVVRAGADGTYVFGAVPDGAYVLVPKRPGLLFSPPLAAVTVSGRDVSGQDFVASPADSNRAISGTVSGPSPDGISVRLSSSPSFSQDTAVTTAAGGRYAFTGLDPGEYLLTPSSPGYTFSPQSRLVEVGAENISGQDFVAVPAPIDRRFEPVCSDGWCWVAPQPQGNVLNRVWGSSARDVWAVGWDVLLHWDGTAWSSARPASPGGADALENILEAVWGSSATDVWAVGWSIQHWDGSAWASVPSGFTDVGVLQLTSIWGSAADDIWAVGGGNALHWNGAAWTRAPLPLGTWLEGVWGSAADDVWAVGLGVILHWDGRSWASVPTPMSELDAFATAWPPPGGVVLTDVWGSSGRDVWAAGGNGVVLHWDGTAWSAVPTPAGWWTTRARIWGGRSNDVWIVGLPGALHWDGTAWSSASLPGILLNGVWGVSAEDVWVVGDAGQMLHWDGATWSQTPSGLLAPALAAIWAHDDADAWAVGWGDAIFHWDGGSWAEVSHPANRSRAIWGAAGDDVWVVGAGALHWDGANWSVVPAPPGTGSIQTFLAAVFGTSASDVWAVGHDAIWHWDGAALSSVPFPEMAFTGVWASAPDDAWAVASGEVTYNPDFPAMAHWDGKTWTPVTDRATAGYLNGVWGSSARDVWAVGDAGRILHFDGAAWSVFPSGFTDDLFAVWGTGADDVWAVGGLGSGSSVGSLNLGGAILHWDGTRWTKQVTPFGPAAMLGGALLLAVSGSPSGAVWAIGTRAILRHQR